MSILGILALRYFPCIMSINEIFAFPESLSHDRSLLAAIFVAVIDPLACPRSWSFVVIYRVSGSDILLPSCHQWRSLLVVFGAFDLLWILS